MTGTSRSSLSYSPDFQADSPASKKIIILPTLFTSLPLFKMSACKTLTRASVLSLSPKFTSSTLDSFHLPHRFPFPGLGFHRNRPRFRSYSAEPAADCSDEPSDSPDDTVEDLLSSRDRIDRLTKMQRRSAAGPGRWFPYLDAFTAGPASLDSQEVIDALDPHIMDPRKERLRRAVENRTYSVCLVVEGLSDFGNVSAAFRSADALGIQSVHVISTDVRKRYRDNRHVSKGAEKWLDIELWKSAAECFQALKTRGYRIVTTHLGTESVSIYDLNWSTPTAIVVGNEHLGISDEALQLSDVHCSIPMKGMVDSFNVSVAAGILMHHVVCDRISRLGRHGDLTSEETQILLAEFYLRHRGSTLSIVHEYSRRKVEKLIPKL